MKTLGIIWNVVALIVFVWAFITHTPSSGDMLKILWVGSVPLVSLIALIVKGTTGRSWLGLYMERKKAEETAKIAELNAHHASRA